MNLLNVKVDEVKKGNVELNAVYNASKQRGILNDIVDMVKDSGVKELPFDVLENAIRIMNANNYFAKYESKDKKQSSKFDVSKCKTAKEVEELIKSDDLILPTTSKESKSERIATWLKRASNFINSDIVNEKKTEAKTPLNHRPEFGVKAHYKKGSNKTIIEFEY